MIYLLFWVVVCTNLKYIYNNFVALTQFTLKSKRCVLIRSNTVLVVIFLDL